MNAALPFTLTAGFDKDSIPADVRSRVIDDGVPTRKIADIDGQASLVVGIPLARVNGAYFEAFSLDQDNRTLSNVALSLLLSATITTGLGVVAGVLAARRAVRPLADASEAAKAIAGGHLDTRLTPTDMLR